MPAIWTITPQAPGAKPGAFAIPEGTGAEYLLRLMPHISMGTVGFVRVIGFTAFFLALPLIGVLGTPILWGLLPFMGMALWGLWLALSSNRKDRSVLCEELRLTRDEIALTRINPKRPAQHWQANPYWVTLTLTPKGGPVENYLTLSGSGREVELGAFLSPEERAVLHDDLLRALRHLR
jgi:uncharacterized membrane protein